MADPTDCPVCRASLEKAEVAALRRQLETAEAGRQRAEQALKDSEKRFQAFLDNGPYVAFMKDKGGRHVYANRRFRQMFHWSPEDGEKTADADHFPPEVVHQLQENDERVLDTGQVLETVEEVPTPDGVLHSWLVFKFPVPQESDRPLLGGVAIDITDRQRGEAELREREKLFRQLTENIREVFLMTSPSMDSVLYVSSAFEEVWGRPRGELCERPRSWIDAILPSDRERWLAAYHQALREGQSSAEFRIARPDGSVRWVRHRAFPIRDESGHIYRIAGIADDITEQRQAETALRESETFHRVISELTADYAYCCSVDANNVIRMESVTEGFTRVTGFPLEELQERGDWPSLIHPDDLPLTAKKAGGILAGQQDVNELRIVTRGGEIRWIRYSSCPLWDAEAGRVTRLIGAVRDITVDKQAEAKLRDSARRLQHLSRRLLQVQERERRHLARELHDEVGQTLTGLMLTLEVAARLSAGEVAAGIGQAQELVRELMARVRDLSLDLRPSMLDDLGLCPALEWHFRRYTAQTDVRVKFELPPLPQPLPAEVATTAYRIVQEALTNVARHSGVREATVRLWAEDERLYIEIADEGAGFDGGHSANAGVSSGLSGMQERADLLGGQLTVASHPGGGTRITAELPLWAQLS